MSKMMSIASFADKYEVTANLIYVKKNQGSIPSRVFSGNGKGVKIDEVYFIKRKKRLHSIVSKAHENFYELTEHYGEYQLATMLSKFDQRSIQTWYFFLKRNLFVQQSERITDMRLTKKMYCFVRYSSWILKRMEKKAA